MTPTDPIHKFNALTDRQKEVLQLVCKGTPYKKIAEKLFIAENTVKTHVGHIYKILELTHLEPSQRIAIIHETYCPLLQKGSAALDVAGDEVEPEPVSPEVEKIVDEDEYALVHLGSPEIIEGEVVELPSRQGSGCLWGLIGVLLGAGLLAAYLFLFGGNIPGIQTQDSPPPQVEEPIVMPSETPAVPIATDTAVVVVVTATSVPASETPLPSDTPVPPTPTATLVPSETPVQDTQPGSVLEVGEWWKEEGVWLRMREYEITDSGGVWIILEFWNKTPGLVTFAWNTSGNLSLRDNTGHNYPLTTQFTNGQNTEAVDAGELIPVENSAYGFTAIFADKALFNAGVNELVMTVIDFSRIDKAQFRIPLN